MILLDTNVISEMMRGPDVRSPTVSAWLRTLKPEVVATTALSVAEIGVGVMGVPAGARRNVMQAAADSVFGLFENRILAFDRTSAVLYVTFVQARKRVGLHHEHIFDLQIAAIAGSCGHTVATRNIGDFAGLDIDLINPWDHPVL